MLGYLTIAVFLVVFSMLVNRLASSIVTAPMVFIGFGAVMAQIGVLPKEGTEATLHLVAEIALIVMLFLSAAKIDQAALLYRRAVWPARMLAVGLPLGFLFGTALGWMLFPQWPLAVVALVAAILVPTDAALGEPVVTNTDIPERPRHALTVESGLNDGLALPLVLFMAVLAAPQSTAPEGGWLIFGLKQISVGPLVGAIAGSVGGAVSLWAKRTGMTSEVYEGIGALALAALAYLAATMIGGNGFIAAFAAGLGFGAVVRGRCAFVFEFTESEGQLFSWGAFLLLGAVLLPEAVSRLTPEGLLMILGSLVVVRPLAIWLSLIGTDALAETRLLFGWFGPRGLATALFALVVAGQLDHDSAEAVLYLAVNAVWISAVLHGVTATAGAKWYARRMQNKKDCAEMTPIKYSTEAFETGMRASKKKLQ